MHSEFWHERWRSGRIGFHQSQVNPLLKHCWSELQADGAGRVLVPLCGKSIDMLWLREQGHEVTGVELNELACQAFWDEQEVPVTVQQTGDFSLREKDGLRLLCGDFFTLPAAEFKTINWVYDRAALVAFPEPMRKRYAQTLTEQLPAGVGMLLITLEFDDAEGPPFSVTEEEVQALYGDRFSIEKLTAQTGMGRSGRAEVESVYIMRDRR
ncbi:thiopurine S-methyltransferase [Amphritea atlantica]|uniref:Thiopurine S-methyltransferase n=1 Tax=Amphritea atlantica TaxID=355243 RepID=A0A1H9LNE3_9GAMM|nr:thiopurine S-methyltransferase [Amphritea atlantica]SER12930.1 thiopurine S-methyltransferase [Amphritea atlantica]